MSAVTDTTNHENGVGRFTNHPYGRLFSEESLMSVVTDTTNHENDCKGDSRIAPTGGYFQRNDKRLGNTQVSFTPEGTLSYAHYKYCVLNPR